MDGIISGYTYNFHFFFSNILLPDTRVDTLSAIIEQELLLNAFSSTATVALWPLFCFHVSNAWYFCSDRLPGKRSSIVSISDSVESVRRRVRSTFRHLSPGISLATACRTTFLGILVSPPIKVTTDTRS